jgi:hypothetical protein
MANLEFLKCRNIYTFRSKVLLNVMTNLEFLKCRNIYTFRSKVGDTVQGSSKRNDKLGVLKMSEYFRHTTEYPFLRGTWIDGVNSI